MTTEDSNGGYRYLALLRLRAPQTSHVKGDPQYFTDNSIFFAPPKEEGGAIHMGNVSRHVNVKAKLATQVCD